MNDNISGFRDHIKCLNCGVLEDIDLIDAKAPPCHPDPDNADFEHMECIACYGPGWETNLTAEQMQTKSIAPHLKPLYLAYFNKVATA
ncbi:MAG: hypothetical protein Q8L13_11605 [Bradyrhizobium sp.]|uniref:hypothetical protein n=1 Tax=Bradyrhizobium sp. TaxID=376 RepID=UPI00272EEF67|nr:hypothetical protein [Bradyrhizobium sp.]MDP1866970.1 hypothetical protein [Bradyrhizobium sp.]